LTLYHDYLYDPSYNTPSPSGIYALVDVHGGKLYIGSTKNFNDRNAQHFKLLEEGIHYNRNLQYQFDQAGPSSFSFVVLEYIPDLTLLEGREQIWIDRFKRHHRSVNVAKAQRTDWEEVHPTPNVILPWEETSDE